MNDPQQIDTSDLERLVTPGNPNSNATDGNRVEHLVQDQRALFHMWDAIEGAEHRAWLTMFNLGADEVGYGTIQRLTAAAARGCEVRLIYDFAGSWTLQDSDFDDLKAAGGRVEVFNRFWPPWRKNGAIGIRNHRKLLIIDDNFAFVGGMNLAEAFVRAEEGKTGIFDDTVVSVRGPAVRELGTIFTHTWQEICGEEIDGPTGGDPFEDGIVVETLETDPRRDNTRMMDVVGSAIASAKANVRMTTPYFVPAGWLIDSLMIALENGVKVEIITAGRTDAAIARLAGHDTYGKLLRAGAQIYEMHGRIIHTKKLTIDGLFCTVGSYNFDVWTSRHVLDASIAALSEPLAESFEEEFKCDIGNCDEIAADERKVSGPLFIAASWMARKIYERL